MKRFLISSITRKLFILAVMSTGLVGLTFGNISQPAQGNEPLCCLNCPDHPFPSYCYRKCDPTC